MFAVFLDAAAAVVVVVGVVVVVVGVLTYLFWIQSRDHGSENATRAEFIVIGQGRCVLQTL